MHQFEVKRLNTEVTVEPASLEVMLAKDEAKPSQEA